MRRKSIAIYLILLFFLCISFDIIPIENATDVLNYYIKNSYRETGSINVVTSIYLNYRVFDTIFETLLLLISIIGIIYFSRHEGDY
ncbi:hydrogen gas-evolving membrane-bound hydrogenase subunit E [Vallitalea guaymasensis]|uniref:hydrogen gas-evolving membrane-bound hydrogenase subunit E n=1 Tax=Vallitalea guaymasensis TaxID=1185412 RepID=UPI000DE4E4FF|nr:hydrogen gas-evolving membrane-bound hydrogenase subunit E [Vallitalea guaymasensis]